MPITNNAADYSPTQYNVQVGGASGTLQNVAPSAASGNPLVSQGAAANPVFSATPTVTSITINNAPSASTDGVNKAYVDAVIAGLTFKDAVYAATTPAGGDLGATYFNGVAGVGATLTNAGVQVAFSVDGVSPAINSRILVKNQANNYQNGAYTLTTVGDASHNWVLTRATDYDLVDQIQPGDLFPVEYGTANAGTFWIETATVAAIGIGNPITFTQFFGGGTETFNADVGSAQAVSGAITVAGGSNINTSAAGSTVTFNLNSTVSVGGSITAGTGLSATTGGIQAVGNSAINTNGTGNTSIANGTNTGTVTIGNTAGAMALDLYAGSGNFILDGAAGTTMTVGASLTTGTISIGGSSQTGTISIGNGGSAQSLNFGTGAAAKTVVIGSTSSTSTTTIQAGSNGIVLSGMTAYAPICGGTTTTTKIQSASTGISNSGWVLTSTGASSLPTFQAPSNTSLTWNNITSGSSGMVAVNGYLANFGTLVTLTLPVSAAQFTVIQVAGFGAGGWLIAQNAGQNIQFGSVSTTVGATGSLASTNRYDQITLLCAVANTTWVVTSGVGNITYN